MISWGIRCKNRGLLSKGSSTRLASKGSSGQYSLAPQHSLVYANNIHLATQQVWINVLATEHGIILLLVFRGQSERFRT